MDVQIKSEDRSLVIFLRGELDHHGARGLIRQLEQEMDVRLPLEVTLDFSGVTFMDSSGIAVVLRCFQQLRSLGGRLRLQAIPPQPRKVLEAAGIQHMVTMDERSST